MENTEHTSPEDTPRKETPEEKHTSPLSKYWKKSSNICQKIHPTWFVTIGFILLLTGVIMHYEYRLHKVYTPYMIQTRPMYPGDMMRYSRHQYDMDDVFEDMDRSFRDMERRHDMMMESMRHISTEMTSGNYAGAKIVDNSTLTYSISKDKDTVSGTLTATESGTLTSLESQLKNLGYAVSKKDTTLSFSGNTDKTEALMNLLR